MGGLTVRHFRIYPSAILPIFHLNLKTTLCIKYTYPTPAVKIKEVAGLGYRLLFNCVYRIYSSINDLLHDSKDTTSLLSYHIPGHS